ncbi:14693_t:CDS:2 [Funneliformis caledonium]|uniref:14693_t:CDS:1 n=1 Tax=Funneliformis caledonium TaxID=1117310 RepID=A0A9N9CKY3_9GLOM|nr:14693_t:CDS:2 [Funneliformis caledonium]
MLRNTKKKNTNRDHFALLVNNKILTKKQNTTQTLDNKLISELLASFIEPILTKDTNTMEVDPIAESLTNNLDKEKGSETLTLENTIQKTIISINKTLLINFIANSNEFIDDQENLSSSLYESSSSSNHDLHKIYNSFCNESSFYPIYSQLSNKSLLADIKVEQELLCKRILYNSSILKLNN